MDKEQINSIISIFVIIALFALSSYAVQNNLGGINEYLDYGIWGMLIYFILVILSIVLAPVSVFPLIPIASKLWGWPLAGIISIVGWTIGAVIAFLLARRYGVPLVSKFLPMKQIYKLEKLIPENHLFLTVVILRIVIPVDGLSYFLGLFSKMKLRSYTLATLIGLTPFALIFSYLGTVELIYQLVSFTIGLSIFLIMLLIVYFRTKIKNK